MSVLEMAGEDVRIIADGTVHFSNQEGFIERGGMNRKVKTHFKI
jgi:hypothetical protein